MIYDTLDNLERYCRPGDALYQAARYAAEFDLEQADGEYEVDGRQIFAKVQSYRTSPAEQRSFEAHRRYYDVQVVRRGAERHDVTLAADLQPLGAYHSANDVIMLEAPARFCSLIMEPGMFAVYYPSDVHRPNCNLDADSAAVRKICMKVRL